MANARSSSDRKTVQEPSAPSPKRHRLGTSGKPQQNSSDRHTRRTDTSEKPLECARALVPSVPHQNLINSRLCRLATEFLAEIAESLDLAGL